MKDDLNSAVRRAAKGSGWSVKHDTLVKRLDGSVLAVHPRRGSKGFIEFRAKPVAWDQLLWSILQISGNEKMPASFHFTGAFTCDTPALMHLTIADTDGHDTVAIKMLELAARCQGQTGLWSGYSLSDAIAAEAPNQPYRYHMTQVIERIAAGDRQSANFICQQASSGALDIRKSFSSTDNETPLDATGGRPSKTFFELAQLWMNRH